MLDCLPQDSSIRSLQLKWPVIASVIRNHDFPTRNRVLPGTTRTRDASFGRSRLGIRQYSLFLTQNVRALTTELANPKVS